MAFRTDARIFGVSLVAVLVALVAFPSPLSAQEGDLKPWAVGVSAEQQGAANRLLAEGNRAYGQRAYKEALRLYRDALEAWDHPAIRFNISDCQIQLDQVVEAYENLIKALAYDGQALEPAIYERALLNKKLLEGQLANLVVENSETGASITLDGEPLPSEPGTVTRVIRPGLHQVVAKKAGRMTQTEDLKVVPGETTLVKIRLLEIGTVPLVRRWSSWKPWAVVGAGAVAAIAGAGLELRARSNMDKYDKHIATNCANGCVESDLPDGIRSARDSAELQDVIGLSLIGVGAATLAAGVVMVVLNQPRRAEEGPLSGPVTIAPTVTPDGAGLSVSLNF